MISSLNNNSGLDKVTLSSPVSDLDTLYIFYPIRQSCSGESSFPQAGHDNNTKYVTYHQ